MHESDSDGRDTGGAGLAPEPGISDGDLLRTVIDLIPALIYAKDIHGRFIVCKWPQPMYVSEDAWKRTRVPAGKTRPSRARESSK